MAWPCAPGVRLARSGTSLKVQVASWAHPSGGGLQVLPSHPMAVISITNQH
jgi:hypothetical protein